MYVRFANLCPPSRGLVANVQDEPQPWLARAVLLGARDVTAMVVGSGALLGGLASSGPNSFSDVGRPSGSILLISFSQTPDLEIAEVHRHSGDVGSFFLQLRFEIFCVRQPCGVRLIGLVRHGALDLGPLLGREPRYAN